MSTAFAVFIISYSGSARSGRGYSILALLYSPAPFNQIILYPTLGLPRTNRQTRKFPIFKVACVHFNLEYREFLCYTSARGGNGVGFRSVMNGREEQQSVKKSNRETGETVSLLSFIYINAIIYPQAYNVEP